MGASLVKQQVKGWMYAAAPRWTTALMSARSRAHSQKLMKVGVTQYYTPVRQFALCLGHLGGLERSTDGSKAPKLAKIDGQTITTA